MRKIHELPTFHARTVYDCWKIARRVAEAYQRRMNRMAKKKDNPKWLTCREARDAADRIALRIRHGHTRHGKPAKRRGL